LKISKDLVISDYYDNYFEKLCYAGLQSRGTKTFHKLIERNWVNKTPRRILEVGAGVGEHFPFVPKEVLHKLEEYVALDIRESELDDLKYLGENEKILVQRKTGSVEKIPFEDGYFDRVTSTCLFHHLQDPLEAFQEVRRVLKVNGEFSIGLPTDPGIANQIVKNLYTYRKAKKIGIPNPKFIYALEHQNHINSLLVILKEVFSNDSVKIKYWPLKIPSQNLNLAVSAHIVKSQH
jgi:ubiquinone/menaquinone biosynthesis C-methylase UbiE